jgi:AraC-like DNA-binding protein
MRKMKPSMNEQAERMEGDRQELAATIVRALPRDGRIEPRPGIYFNRVSLPRVPVHAVVEPSFCVIAQGSKDILLGHQRFRYDSAHYLIATVSVPATGQVVEASTQRPYLGFRMVLDAAVVTSVMVESGHVEPRGDEAMTAIDVSPLDVNLLNATLRLTKLIESPHEYRVLGPLVVREIVYRLLTGVQGNRLRHLATFGGQGHRMARAVEKIRNNFDRQLKIEAVARELGMSVSGFHAKFKAVTAMSPLQFQKELRLQEARRLMISEKLDAGEAGFKVGYEDPSYFSRDYKRHFGESPVRDVERLRELAATV